MVIPKLKFFIRKKFFFIVILLFFIGCEDDKSIIPLVSENENETSQNQFLNEDNSKEDIVNVTPITKTSIASIESNNSQQIENKKNNGFIKEDQPIEEKPTLIDEDINYINTQFESIFFDYDRYSIKEDMLPIIEKNIKLMNTKQLIGKTIIIEGNCDEWGTDEYNYALGLKRAQIIKEAFIAEGIDENRIKVVTFGESNPICLEQTDECWAKNRRVDFRLEE
jgi:peptidoglycan-associated lipoprotein